MSEVAPRRRRVWPWVLTAVVVLPLLAFAACTAAVGSANAPRDVGYSVEGEGKATVSYTNTNGTGQESNVPLPWNKTVTLQGAMGWGSVTATLGAEGGSVTCRISGPDGAVFAENAASGPFASATCHGTAPNR